LHIVFCLLLRVITLEGAAANSARIQSRVVFVGTAAGAPERALIRIAPLENFSRRSRP
jgi:hypothetical protein